MLHFKGFFFLLLFVKFIFVSIRDVFPLKNIIRFCYGPTILAFFLLQISYFDTRYASQNDNQSLEKVLQTNKKKVKKEKRNCN